jgi:hypothetical protein
MGNVTPIPGSRIRGVYTAKLKQPPATWTPDWLDHLNNNYRSVRSLRARLDEVHADISAGAPETLSWSQRRLASHLVWCDAILEDVERRFARGDGDVEFSQFAALLGVFARVTDRLGLKRKKRTVNGPLL